MNGTRLPQVSVLIEFELQGCDNTLNCQRTFNTHIYETSTENATAARNINNYRQVQRVSPNLTNGSRVNATITVSFNSGHSSFHFAIQDETSCLVITRMIIFALSKLLIWLIILKLLLQSKVIHKLHLSLSQDIVWKTRNPKVDGLHYLSVQLEAFGVLYQTLAVDVLLVTTFTMKQCHVNVSACLVRDKNYSSCT